MSSKDLTSYGLDPDRLPAHVAMIMDGNGRWAKKRLMNRVRGHETGSETVRSVVRTTREMGIPYLSLYAFSTENWERPKTEVTALMTLLRKFLSAERREMEENGIRLNAIGELDRLPDGVRKDLDATIAATRENTRLVLTLCLSYGSRSEILHGIRQMAREVADGRLAPDAITEASVSRSLYTENLPDPDLLIRTSGEQRLSNFLLWQLAYAEFVFTPTLWPDFSREEYIRILQEYQDRDRRFGKVTS